MNKLPFDSSLPINCLASIFNDRSTSYKFLLFKSILESVNEGNEKLQFDDLALRSLSYASYSINFYKLNYGYNDQISIWVKKLSSVFPDQAINAEKFYMALKEGVGSEDVKGFIKEFKKFVPYRLIAPWFKKELEGKADSEKNALIAKLADDATKKSLYQIILDQGQMSLVISPAWAEYLKANYSFILGWWKAEFLVYLQKNNPTVLSLATKLESPVERNMNDVKKLFRDYFKFKEIAPRCFYSGLLLETISHDHFMPWSFMGSDPIYNFVPALKEINSKKSDSIPHEKYLNQLAEFQFDVFSFIREHKSKSVLFENYMNDLHLDENDSLVEFMPKLNLFYKPLFLTSSNQGFHQGWEYIQVKDS
jgi:hypothetical protein